MLQKLVQQLKSYRSTLILMLLCAVCLAVATWFEKGYGAEYAKIFFYHSPLLIFLYLLIVANFLLSSSRRWSQKGWMKRDGAYVVTHFAFLVILAGATWSHLFGKEGLVHIREGKQSNQMLVTSEKEHRVEELPFWLELKDFRLIRYPGSGSPASYESDIVVHQDGEERTAEIYMNNVLDIGGYRFYQASYDEDEQGTILSVSYDSVGTTITYLGYALLIVGFVLMLAVPHSYFRRQWRALRTVQRRLAGLLLLPLLCSPALRGEEATPAPHEGRMGVTQEMIHSITDPDRIPLEQSEAFGLLPIQWQGRIVPLNTLSTQLVRKLTGEDKIAGLTADQFILSFLAMPEAWMQLPIISVGHQGVADKYFLSEEYASFANFFDVQGAYKLAPTLEKIYQKAPQHRTKEEKELVKLDERVNILYSLYEGQLIHLFPDAKDSHHTWYALADKGASPLETDRQLYLAYLQAVRKAMMGGGSWQEVEPHLAELKRTQQAEDMAGLIQPDRIKAERWYNESNIFAKCRLGYFVLGGLLLLVSFMEITRRRSRATTIVGRILTWGILIVMLTHIAGMGLRWYISGYGTVEQLL